MAKLETVAVRPDRILVKTFRPVALPGFRISQTKFIADKDQLYCVLGQKTFHSPLYTHFIVIDSYGDLVDDRTGLKIYEKISRLNIVQYFQKRDISFVTNQSDVTNFNEHEQFIKELFQEGEQVSERFQALEKEAIKLFKKSEWKISDFERFDQQWRRFWQIYERRLEKLFKFRKIVIQNNSTENLKENPMKKLFVEANEMYQLFIDSIPLNGPLIKKVNHFIQLHFELGKTKTSHTRQYAAPKGDVNIYYFVKFGFIISLLLVIWTLIRLISGKGSLLVFGAMLIIAMFFFSIRIGNEVGMLRLVEKRLKELRAKRLSSLPIIQRQYEKPYRQLKETSTNVIEPFKFVGALVKIPRWFLILGVVLVIIGFLFYRLQNVHPLMITGYLFFGSLLVALGLFLPRTNLAKRTFVLKDNELQIGKRTYTREDIVHIKLFNKANRLKIKLRTHPDPITYKIDQTIGETINTKLQTWCDVHFVNYKK